MNHTPFKQEIWRVCNVDRPTSDSVQIEFDTLGRTFHYSPGQFINLTMPIQGKQVTRSYSLSSWHGIHSMPSILVKAVPGGVMSNYLVQEISPGMYAEVEGPVGNFIPSPYSLVAPTVVLIAGGSGISPLRSIVHYFLHQTKQKLVLIYATKTYEQIIFLNELMQLAEQYPQRFQHWHAVSQAAALPSALPGIAARLGPLVLRKLLKTKAGIDISKAAYFLCGPSAMMQMATETLAEAGVHKQQIQHEDFLQTNMPHSGPSITQLLPQQVLMYIENRVNLLDVASGQSILSAALAEGLPVKFSCLKGTCGSCWAKLTQGSVVHQQNYALSQDQLNEGYVLLCQAHPCSADVTLEINSFI